MDDREPSTVGRGERFIALTFCCMLLAAAAMVAPLRSVDFGSRPSLLAMYGIVLGATEIVTALLLLWRAQAERSLRLGLLAAAYVFSAPLLVMNVALLPGVAAGLASPPQAGPWIWVAWHLGWVCTAAVYALARERRLRRTIFPAILAGAAACLVVAAALRLPAMPVLLAPDRSYTPLLRALYACCIGVALLGIAGIVRRRRTLGHLDVWIAVALFAIALDAAVTALGAARFSLGFYAGRALGMLSGGVVLVALVISIAQLVGRADRSLREQLATQESERRTRAFLEALPQIVWIARADGFVEWYNGRWYEMTGQSRDSAAGHGWTEACHPDDREPTLRRLTESAKRGEPFEAVVRFRGADGRYRWYLSAATPEFDESGRVTRWSGTSTNIDSERIAKNQLDFFANLGDLLGRSLDRGAALDALVVGLVPSLADWAVVNIVDAEGALILSAAHHRDPVKARLLEPFLGTSCDLANPTSISARVYASGKAIWSSDITVDHVREGLSDAFAAVVEQLGVRTLIGVPIVANGVSYGSFIAMATEGVTTYTESDVPFFREVGLRMGYALQNAELYRRESRIAKAFQSAALPSALPHVPGLVFSHLYEPASRDANVGGDFYDAFRLADGRVIVTVGDVAGAGITAAATMASLRQRIRAIASVNPDPAILLKAADDAFTESAGPPFASAFVALIEPMSFGLRYANAGHPPPILRAPDGTLTTLGAGDMLLGLDLVSTPGQRVVKSITVAPGSLLVMYTDGISEADRDLLGGEQRLYDVVRAYEPALHATSRAATAIRDAILGAGAASGDDTALLTLAFDARLRTAAPNDVARWAFACGDALAARRARNGIVAMLEAGGASFEDVFATEVVFAELVGNVLRHAPLSEVEVLLDLTQEFPVLHVIDDGEGFSLNSKLPSDAYAERGRGLYIITQLSREFTVAPRTLVAGSHARVVLPGRRVRGRANGAPAKESAPLASHEPEMDDLSYGAST